MKENAKEGVNIAGHFIISTWGCGTDCRELTIIDARTGVVYFTPSLVTENESQTLVKWILSLK